MEATIHAVNSVEYDLKIKASALDLEPQIEAELKKVRNKIKIDGFRPGTAPLQMIRKMHGQAITQDAIEKLINKVYKEQVYDNETYAPIGHPVINKMDYDNGVLDAEVRFGVRPEFEAVGLEGESLTKLVHFVEEADLDSQLEYIQFEKSTLEDTEDALDEEMVAKVDLQELDLSTGEMLIGNQFIHRDLEINLKDPRVLANLKEALIGKKVGENFEIVLNTGTEESAKENRYAVSITKTQKRNTPELNDALIEEFTNGRFNNVADLREDMRQGMQADWDNNAKTRLENKIIERVLSLNTFEMPASAVDLYLDGYIREQADEQGNLPKDFDLATFIESKKDDAEKAARWFFIRDKLVKQHEVTVNDEDLDAFFAKRAAEFGQGITADFVEKLYKEQGALEQISSQLLTEKTLEILASQATIVEKSRADFEKEEAENIVASEESADSN